jgi:hypothetical protein
MKKVSIGYLVLILFWTSCENTDQPSEFSNENTSEEIYYDLMEAYNAQDHEKLIAFLDSWEQNNPCHPVDKILDETNRDIYEIFIILFTPFDIGRLGEHEWGSEMYKGIDYVIVQNKIFYDYAFDAESSERSDSVADFRPPVSFPGKTVLFLTENYHRALTDFLQNDFNPLGTGGIMNPASPSEESLKRYQFLSQELAIIPGHWGGYWHIETHPYIYTIHFNANITKAKAFFRVGYMFGEAELQKKDSTWELLFSSITMIE